MAEITREEFQKIYDEKFVPILEPLESERVKALEKAKTRVIIVLFVVFPLVILFSIIYMFLLGFVGLFVAPFVGIAILLALGIIIYWGVIYNVRLDFKKEILPKLLSIYGNLYFSNNTNVVDLGEIQSYGLFPNVISKRTDDVIIGTHRGLNCIIMEAVLSCSNSTAFKGLIVKAQMNKSLACKTVIGRKGKVVKKKGFDKVELESVDFMKYRDIFATDQIEARYILTTAFIERIKNLGAVFSGERMQAMTKNQGVSSRNDQVVQEMHETLYNSMDTGDHSKCSDQFMENVILPALVVSVMFSDEFVYLFIPTFENFFEIDVEKSLLNFEQYYKIYNELDSILSVVDYLNLDSKTGL